MTKGRIEAFSDGVIAIIIAIMVLELKVPHGDQLADLRPVVSGALYVPVALIWLIPDPRIESHLAHQEERAHPQHPG